MTPKSHTLMSHSCLLWNCKIMFRASVSVTLFCAHLADRRHLCCPTTCQDENSTFITLCARKIRAFNKTRTCLSGHAPEHVHYLTLKLTLLIMPRTFFLSRPTSKLSPERFPSRKRVTWDAGFITGHLCSLVFVSPASKWCKRTASIMLLWSFIASNFLCLANLAEICRGMLSCPLCQPLKAIK